MSDIAEPDNDIRDTAEYLGVLLPPPYPAPAGLPHAFNVLDFATFKGGSEIAVDIDWYSLTIPEGVQKINISVQPKAWDGSDGSTFGGILVESIQFIEGAVSFSTNPNLGLGLPNKVDATFDVTPLFESGQPLVTFFFNVYGIEATIDPDNPTVNSPYTLTVNFVEYINNPTNTDPNAFNPLEYIASYPDLIGAFGPDPGAGEFHYLTAGFNEGREISFDGLQYIASYEDLIRAFGADRNAGAAHYITSGSAEGRLTDDFNEVQYVANYSDLQSVFSSDYDAATAHYITNGKFEGRTDEPILPSSDFLI